MAGRWSSMLPILSLLAFGASAAESQHHRLPHMNGTYTMACVCNAPFQCASVFATPYPSVLQDETTFSIVGGPQESINGKVDDAGAVSLTGYLQGVWTSCNGTFSKGNLLMRCSSGKNPTGPPPCAIKMACVSGKCMHDEDATTGAGTTGTSGGTGSTGSTTGTSGGDGTTGVEISSGSTGDSGNEYSTTESYVVPSGASSSESDCVLLWIAFSCFFCAACLATAVCIRRCRRRAAARERLIMHHRNATAPGSGSLYPAVAAAASTPAPTVAPARPMSPPAVPQGTVFQHPTVYMARSTSPNGEQTTQYSQYSTQFFYPAYPPMPMYAVDPSRQQAQGGYVAYPQMPQMAVAYPQVTAPVARQAQPETIRAPPTMQRARPDAVDTSADERLARALQAQYDNEMSLL